MDQADKFPSNAREVWIVTSLCVDWDEIFLATSEVPETAVTSVAPETAKLRYHREHYNTRPAPRLLHPLRGREEEHE